MVERVHRVHAPGPPRTGRTAHAVRRGGDDLARRLRARAASGGAAARLSRARAAMPGWGEPLTNPASVGLDASRLGRLAAWGEQLVADGQAPFAMSLVARRGKVAHVAKAGESKPGKPVQFDALCRMHSMSKPVTSVALMILHDEGKFQLGDPAWKFLGEKWKPENMRVLVPGGTSDDYETVPCERAVTCHHLLTHTAGLSYGLNPTDGRVQSPVAAQEAANPLDGIYERMGVTIHSALGAAPLSTTLAQFVDKLAECPLMYQPGEKWHYSLATDVCGMLVEAISGMSFWEFLRTRLFVPLGMLDTFFVIPPDKADRQADVYRPGWGADGSDTAPSPTAAMTSIVNISGHDGQDFSTPHVYLIRTALVYSSLCLSRIH